MKPIDMNPVRMRIIEQVNKEDEVITYFDVWEIDQKYYYEYNKIKYGPYNEFNDAVESAYANLIPVSE